MLKESKRSTVSYEHPGEWVQAARRRTDKLTLVAPRADGNPASTGRTGESPICIGLGFVREIMTLTPINNFRNRRGSQHVSDSNMHNEIEYCGIR